MKAGGAILPQIRSSAVGYYPSWIPSCSARSCLPMLYNLVVSYINDTDIGDNRLILDYVKVSLRFCMDLGARRLVI